jgi:hypothetical protein
MKIHAVLTLTVLIQMAALNANVLQGMLVTGKLVLISTNVIQILVAKVVQDASTLKGHMNVTVFLDTNKMVKPVWILTSVTMDQTDVTVMLPVRIQMVVTNVHVMPVTTVMVAIAKILTSVKITFVVLIPNVKTCLAHTNVTV